MEQEPKVGMVLGWAQEELEVQRIGVQMVVALVLERTVVVGQTRVGGRDGKVVEVPVAEPMVLGVELEVAC